MLYYGFDAGIFFTLNSGVLWTKQRSCWQWIMGLPIWTAYGESEVEIGQSNILPIRYVCMASFCIRHRWKAELLDTTAHDEEFLKPNSVHFGSPMFDRPLVSAKPNTKHSVNSAKIHVYSMKLFPSKKYIYIIIHWNLIITPSFIALICL